MKRVHIILEGRVQGVGYRYFVINQAKKYNIKGRVRNNPDRTVEIIAEGADSQIKLFINKCKVGPPSSVVSNVKQSDEDYKGDFTTFEMFSQTI
jgi:acylphosphatase